MKYIIAVAVMGGILGGMTLLAMFNQPEYVENVQPEIEEPITPPDCMSVVQDEDACNAANDVIRKKELEAELNALESNFAALTATYEADKVDYLAKKIELEKALGVY